MNRRDILKAFAGVALVPSVSVLRREPSDVIVIEAPGHLSAETIAHMRHMFSRVGIDPRKVVVLEAGLTMKIAKATDVL